MSTLGESDALYRSVFEALDEGFCVIELIRDDHGAAIDYRFIETNAAFEGHTGLEGACGKTARELIPDLEAHWFETYGRVADTGGPMRFVGEAEPMDGRAFDVFAIRFGGAGSDRVALHFTDISRRKRAEEALNYRADQVRTLLERAPIGVCLVDAGLRVADVNAAALAMFEGIPDPIGRDFEEVLQALLPLSLADRVLPMFRHTMETGEAFLAPEFAEVGGASYDWRIERVPLADGRHGAVCYFTDATEQIESRRALAASEVRYRTLFDSIDEGFCIMQVLFDDDDLPIDYRYLELNPAFEQQSGIRGAQGRSIREMVPDIEQFWVELYGSVAITGEPRRAAHHAVSMGRWFDVYAFRLGEPHERRVAVLFSDVTERKGIEEALRESEARLRHSAYHDALTGLPNRALFEDRLRQALAGAARHGRLVAVLFLDIDGFKLVNDGFGHDVGDDVLVEGARRLRACLREEDTLARLHGDEFALVLTGVADAEGAERLAWDLLEALTLPFAVGQNLLTVSASIGLSVFPRDGSDSSDLLRAADAAMYRAKLGGKNGVKRFSPDMRAVARDRVVLAGALEGALDRGEIAIRFQPQWDGRTGSILTFEALLRWTHPELGEVSPARFVPVAEERGVFSRIVAWGLEECGAFAQDLSRVLGMPLRIALNVSPARLASSTFLAHVASLVARYRLDPRQLELEVSLSAIRAEVEALRAAIVRAKQLGVRVTLERFGADAAMVTPVLDLPIDGVKIDSHLVQRVDADYAALRALTSVVGLARGLGFEVTAAGVETPLQRDLMLELGCDRIQGSLIGPPMERAQAEATLRGQSAVTLF